ncbi:unnamed protein product [Echinostoma caproni]|uniref:MARVEL domain-containing protein n=1 Tax=Echinostoma caproni TaxID=27848 RepID=A0A183A722_9TREM|nr:unnamed protein product [Echinostoma caproni]
MSRLENYKQKYGTGTYLNNTEQFVLIEEQNILEQNITASWIQRANASEKQRNWNRPTVTDVQGEGATALESLSEPSQVPNNKVESAPNTFAPKNQNDITRMAVTPQDQTSSHLSQNDDSYFIPNQSSSSAPRMIQQGQHGRATSMNAFRRLKNMSNAGEAPDKLPALPPPGDLGPYGYPTTKNEQVKPKQGYPGTKEYKATRCFCCWTSFLIALLICCALVTAGVAVLKGEKKCTAVSATLIVSDIIAIVIAVIEWIRLWIWREPLAIRQQPSLRYAAKANPASSTGPAQGGANLPAMASEPGPLPNTTAYTSITANDGPAGGFLSHGFQQRLYDVPQFISAIFLILLYSAAAFCVFCTIAASASKLNDCGAVATSGLGFSAVMAIFILLRMMLCCLSDACQGIFFKTAQATSGGLGPIPMVAVNQLHQNLPGIGRQISQGGDGGVQQPTAWLMNLSNASDPRQHLSICQPMPAKFSQDFTP